MKRFHLLFFSSGLAILFLGITFILLSNQPVSGEGLPAGHPAIPATVGTTINDFFLPGSQPGMMDDVIDPPEDCRVCHAGYNELIDEPPDTETWVAWRGSMMSQAARDPLFYAALDIANDDAAGSGDVCLRCHAPRGWLNGRADPPDGSALDVVDQEGVQCEICHRMVDPVYTSDNPDRDLIVLAEISPTLNFYGNGALVVDPLDERRGPFDLQEDWNNNPHLPLPWPLVSPFHQESHFCGSCHDVSNPIMTWDESSQSYVLNELDAPLAAGESPFPVERTFSEWLLSDYNSPEGIYAPQFGGNEPYVSTCQDCHMRKITGAAATYFGNIVTRTNMPLHDLTGGNTWVPQTIPLHPTFGENFTGFLGELRAQALITGTIRARYMLQNAATMQVIREGDQLYVTVFNQTGHKLPTGYPEGRRMWIQIEGYDGAGNLVYSSGAYDYTTGVLAGYESDPTLKVYEIKQGLTADWAAALGLPAGPTFHFILNNMTYSDNRIPPRGYDYQDFLAAGAAPFTNGQPDPNLYVAGQYWDTTVYTLPAGVVTGTVRLLYQTASKEYIEFLQANNPNSGNPDNAGQILYELWEQTDRSRPEIMAALPFAVSTNYIYLPAVTLPQ